ncbi:MAG: glutaredoxin family protein [Nevskiales bacterium]
MLLLTRPECGLCEEFLEELAHEFPRLAAVVRIAGVDDREDWRALYGRRIPVLLGEDGEVWGEGVLDPATIARRLAARPDTAV